MPPKLTAGHYALVYGDDLWVFPGPKNAHMRRVHCCDLTTLRWSERTVSGECPCDPAARRNLDCFLDGNRMLVVGECCLCRQSSMCYSLQEQRLLQAARADCVTVEQHHVNEAEDKIPLAVWVSLSHH